MFRSKITNLILLAVVLALIVSVANADFTFGIPINLGPTVNGSVVEAEPSISVDGLELFFCGDRPGGSGNWDLWVTTRISTEDDWGTPVNLGPTVNSSAHDLQATISSDGLELYFVSKRSGGSGNYDTWVTRRAAKEDDWAPPMNLGPPINTSSKDLASISADGLELYITSNRPGGFGSNDLWVSTRATTEDDWGNPVNLGPTVNSPYSEGRPRISADGLMLFFSDGTKDQRPDGFGDSDIWMTMRKTRDAAWSEPVNLGSAVNTPYIDRGASPSADGSTLYFCSNRPGGYGSLDLWQVSIDPVVDFNGDGIVDSADMCIMVDYWGTDEPLCDIGPMPWGDGIVDVQDLIVLAEHLFEEVLPPELVAYWKLDETEGDIAYDSAAGNDAVVFGDAIWQPDGGQVNGALQLDGIDDYFSTPPMLDRANAVFSVFAWVKGGMPGQVIFSQAAVSDWLGADTTNGSLMTELRFLGKASLPLQSQTVITDGNWHRVGLVWDGFNRILYVDDVQVASDTYDKGWLVGGLQIGAGKNLEAGTFFSGLIDDVRIYNRAITP